MLSTALAAQGAQIVEADLAKSETLVAALRGAYGVSGLTDCEQLRHNFEMATRAYVELSFGHCSHCRPRRREGAGGGGAPGEEPH